MGGSMLRLIIICFAMILFLSTSAYSYGNVIFSNPYDENDPSGFSSASISDGVANHCYTDFYYDGNYSITDFHWWGTPRIPDASAELLGFTFQIWSNADGADAPGTLLYNEFIEGNAGATYVDDALWGVYKHGFDLSTPFSGSKGKLWFSVFANMIESTQPYAYTNWFWATGENVVGTNDWIQTSVYSPNSSWIQTQRDMAFEVTSTIPEPATLCLLGLGIIGLALRKRNK